MLAPEGLCLDFESEILFRPTSSKSTQQHLTNRHGEKRAIDRAPALDCPQQLAPSISERTQIGVGYGSRSQMIFPSLLSIAPRASIILPSEQLSRPGRKSIADLEASPLSSLCKIGRTVWSKRRSLPHSPRAMGGHEALGDPLARSFPSRPLDNVVTQSPVMPHETSSDSLIEPRKTGVTKALPSHKSQPPGDDTRSEGIPSTISSNLNTDTSASSPPFISAVPSTNETAYPSIISQLTTPITAVRTNPTEVLDEAVLIPPFMPLATVPNGPRSFNVKRKPPPPRSNLATSSPTSIIAGQTSSGTCGGSGSPQGIGSSSLMYKGVSKSLVPPSSMDRKLEPFLGEESNPLASASKRKSVASTSSGSSYLTTVGPTPQSSFPDLPSPPKTRTPRLSMKRLLPSLVKHPSGVPDRSSVGPKGRSPNLTTPAAGDKFESGTTLGDQIRSSNSPGSHPVYPHHSSSSLLTVINKVLRSNDVVLSKEHHSSIQTGDVQSSKAQPDVQATSTNSRDPNSVCETGGEEKGLPPPPPLGRNRKNSKMGCNKTKREEMDIKPAKRRRNVLRKRSNPSMIGLSRSTSTLGSSRSPSDHDGHPFGAIHTREHEEPLHRSNRRPHDIDRISINQLQSVAVPDREILHSSTGLFNGTLGMKDVGLLTSVHEGRNVALEGPRKSRQGGVSDEETLTPAALIAMECKARMSEGSGNPDESYVVSDPRREGKPEESTCDGTSIKDRSLLRSASMSEILFFRPGSVYGQEPIYCEQRDKRGDRARQSLNLSIAILPNKLEEEKSCRNADVVSSKAGGGRLRRLMRKFSLSRPGGKRNEQTPVAFPSVVKEVGSDRSPSRFSRISMGPSRISISNPEISSARPTAPKTSPANEIPPLPKRPISVPLDLHIVNPSVLDQTCHEEVDRTLPQNPSVLSTSSPKVPPEGEWIRSNSPDLELAALPLPPRRSSKVSTGPSSQSGVDADDTSVTHSRSRFVPVVDNPINTSLRPTLAAFPPRSDSLNSRQSCSVARTSPAKNGADLPSGVPNLTLSGSVIPSISVSPPPHHTLTNTQRPKRKRLFVGDTHPKLDSLPRINTNNIPPQRKHSSQEYLSEARGTSSNHGIAQPMPVRKSMIADTLVRGEETDPNSNSYLTFTRSSLSATSSVVFRPGTANTFGGSEILESNIRPGTSDSVQSAISTSTERVKSYSPLSGSSLRLTASPTSFTSTETS